MNYKICRFAICLFIGFSGLTSAVNAQFKPDLQAKEKQSENPRINTSLFTQKKAQQEYVPVDYGKFTLDSLIVNREPHFRIIREKSDNGSIWLTGRIPQDNKKNAEENVYEWIAAAAGILKIDYDPSDFTVESIINDRIGQTHVRMQQHHKGIPVYDAQFIVHLKNNQAYLQNGVVYGSEALPDEIAVKISEEEARKIIMKTLDNYQENINHLKGVDIKLDFEQWQVELVLYNNDQKFIPAYDIRVYPHLAEHMQYMVDATTGEIIKSYSNICRWHYAHENCSSNPPDGPRTANAQDLWGINRLVHTYEVANEFYLIDGSRDMFAPAQSVLPDDPKGVIWTIDLHNTSPENEDAIYSHIFSEDNDWSDSPEGISAHFNAAESYNYFKSTFGRESISGDGQNIISFVNVGDADGNSLGNAFWNGLAIFYGNGDNAFFPLARALDVAGHEMSHGVVQATANLEYFGESGALNESFADIFGAMIDREDWLIGEDVVRAAAFPSGALRNMEDPHNGAAFGDFNSGWQPSHVNEKYTGEEDNAGVHFNSGIPNHAYYLFAEEAGKDIAEDVYYRALTTYLTRSSGFNELRAAVIQSAGELYGALKANMAAASFDAVGILESSNNNFETDLDVNPGDDLLLVSDQDRSNLLLFDLATQQAIFNPLTNVDQLSRPSVTDDGSRIVFTGTDNHLYLIDIDWASNPPGGVINRVSYTPDWRNAVISRDGNRLALLDVSLDNTVTLIDIPSNTQQLFELYNPTYSEGVETGEVLFADAMEFDHSGTVLMYDAFNEVQGNSGTIEYWDIGFIEVWDNEFEDWADGRVAKLFGALPEGISIGNPSFSENSPYIIAMDYLDDQDFSILGLNIESGELNEIIPNSGLGYPNYSRNDQYLIYDFDFLGNIDLGILELNPDKISRVNNSDDILGPDLRWGVWFSNGFRSLSTSAEEPLPLAEFMSIYPNPVGDRLYLHAGDKEINGMYALGIYDLSGKLIHSLNLDIHPGEVVDIEVSELRSGMYLLELKGEKKQYFSKFVKP